MSNLAGVHGKLAEARFFLDLLGRIENGQPVTTEPLDSEAIYFTSALLNACYSVGEVLAEEGKKALKNTKRSNLIDKPKEEVKNLRDQNPDLYFSKRGSDKYGLRPLSVHHKPVGAKRIPSPGGYGTARYGTRRYGAGGASYLYVVDPFSGERISIVPRMTKHVRELEELVRGWETLID